MKFRRTPQFNKDYEKLAEVEKALFKEAFSEIAESLQGNSELFQKHRLKKMVGYPGVWEGHIRQNLVFTYELMKEGDETVCLFRRIGTHQVYRNP